MVLTAAALQPCGLTFLFRYHYLFQTPLALAIYGPIGSVVLTAAARQPHALSSSSIPVPDTSALLIHRPIGSAASLTYIAA